MSNSSKVANLKFVEHEYRTERVTKYWKVLSARDESMELGSVYWYSHWRKYVFAPKAGTIYDTSCLSEISDFCHNSTVDHRKKRSSNV